MKSVILARLTYFPSLAKLSPKENTTYMLTVFLLELEILVHLYVEHLLPF